MQGDTINVTAQATYYFGGPVANAQVRCSVLAADRSFNYQGKGWWDFTDYDYSRAGDYYGSYGEVIAEGNGSTDARGPLHLQPGGRHRQVHDQPVLHPGGDCHRHQ